MSEVLQNWSHKVYVKQLPLLRDGKHPGFIKTILKNEKQVK
jgi:hypothetical protein